MDFDQYRMEVGAMMKRASSGRQEISNMVRTVINHQTTKAETMPPADTGSANSFTNSFKGEGNLGNYEFGKMLGKGSYAMVSLATDLKNNKKVAVKTYDKAKLYNKTRKTIVEREIQVLSFVNHPNIIKLHTSIQTRNHVSIKMNSPVNPIIGAFGDGPWHWCLIVTILQKQSKFDFGNNFFSGKPVFERKRSESALQAAGRFG